MVPTQTGIWYERATLPQCPIVEKDNSVLDLGRLQVFAYLPAAIHGEHYPLKLLLLRAADYNRGRRCRLRGGYIRRHA